MCISIILMFTHVNRIFERLVDYKSVFDLHSTTVSLKLHSMRRETVINSEMKTFMIDLTRRNAEHFAAFLWSSI